MPQSFATRALAASTLALALAGPTSAQDVIPTASPLDMPRPTGMAGAAVEAPTLDGDVLGDPAYRDAPVMHGFLQEQPLEGEPSSERTEVRMIFTKDTLYIGVVCYDRDPSGIVVSDARRDAPLDDTDSFQIIFDTYRDQQNGFVFGTNPAGIEYDGQVTNEGQGGGGLAPAADPAAGSGGGFNVNWDGAWKVRAKIADHRLERRVRDSVRDAALSRPARDQTWGVNFQRNIRRRNERAYWAPIPRQFNLYRVSLAGTVSGVQTPALRNLKLTPYVLGNALESGVEPADTEADSDVGGDLKYSITPSLTLDATVNTDFAQVEVDDQQVNLDRFNLFFPEKRPFFLENAGFFAVGNPGEVDLFFSRRIGIDDRRRGRFRSCGGGRVSGKVGRYNIGLLNMQTADVDASVPSDNFGVVRVARDLPNRSSIGALVRQPRRHRRPRRRSTTQPDLRARRPLGASEAETVVSGLLRRAPRRPASRATTTPSTCARAPTCRKVDVDLGYQEVGHRLQPRGRLPEPRAATASPTSA